MTTAKATAAAAAGAITTILVWVVGVLGLDVPPEVASAITALLATFVVWRIPNAEVR